MSVISGDMEKLQGIPNRFTKYQKTDILLRNVSKEKIHLQIPSINTHLINYMLDSTWGLEPVQVCVAPMSKGATETRKNEREETKEQTFCWEVLHWQWIRIGNNSRWYSCDKHLRSFFYFQLTTLRCLNARREWIFIVLRSLCQSNMQW